MSVAQLKIVDKPQMPEGKQPEGRERRKWGRAMVSVGARICGGVGTLESFEEIVTCLDISREGIRFPTTRAGYIIDQHLDVTCPFWDNPTAINTPRAAKVIRCAVIPSQGYEVAVQFLSNKPEESFVLRQAAAAFASQNRTPAWATPCRNSWRRTAIRWSRSRSRGRRWKSFRPKLRM
jgi:hypothetical protein